MKKFLSMMLALMLMLTSISAMAAQGDAILGLRDAEGNSDDYINRIFTDGDTLYLVGYENLYTYHVGDAEPVKYAWDLQMSSSGTESDEDATGYSNQNIPFAMDGKLYVITLYSSYNQHSEFIKAVLYELTLTEDNKAQGAEVRELDWSSMVEYSGEDSYARAPEQIIPIDGVLYMMTYDMNGNYELLALNLETGATSVADVTDIVTVAPYKDNTILVEQFNYNQGDAVRFLAYNPADESTTMLGEFKVENYNLFDGLAYDPGTDTVYCLRSGEICPLNITTGEVGEGVADLPLETYSNASACVLNGGYYAYCSSAVAVRNLDPTQRAEKRLKIYDGAYSDVISNAYYEYSNAHGDVSVAISRDYNDAQNLVENMMNRDGSIDIFVLSTNSEQYEAIHNRGYMMELSDNEKIRSLIDRMYPTLQESFLYNGQIVAIPVQCYSWSMGVNEKALEKLGLTIADVPTNWSDFLDFLNELPQYMNEDSKVSLFYSGDTAENAKYNLFYQIFEDYQNYVNHTDPSMGYNTDLMRTLLQKLESVDFTALGLESETAQEEDSMGGAVIARSYAIGSEDDMQLFESSMGVSFGNFHSGYTPILMSMDAQTPAFMTLDMNVAFINPFSENRDAAMAFMEQIVDSLPQIFLYNLDPTLNEPIRNSYYEKNIEEMTEALEKLKADYEKAEDADKQMLEEQIKSYEESLEIYKNEGWDASQEQIEWYRANDDNVVCASVNWIYSEAAGGEAAQLIQQYLDGQIDANQMLSGIDQKVQMMLMEGN